MFYTKAQQFFILNRTKFGNWRQISCAWKKNTHTQTNTSCNCNEFFKWFHTICLIVTFYYWSIFMHVDANLSRGNISTKLWSCHINSASKYHIESVTPVSIPNAVAISATALHLNMHVTTSIFGEYMLLEFHFSQCDFVLIWHWIFMEWRNRNRISLSEISFRMNVRLLLLMMLRVRSHTSKHTRTSIHLLRVCILLLFLSFFPSFFAMWLKIIFEDMQQ